MSAKAKNSFLEGRADTRPCYHAISILSLMSFGDSWSNLSTKLCVLNVKFCFTSGQWNLYYNFPNIVQTIVNTCRKSFLLVLFSNIFSKNKEFSKNNQFTSLKWLVKFPIFFVPTKLNLQLKLLRSHVERK